MGCSRFPNYRIIVRLCVILCREYLCERCYWTEREHNPLHTNTPPTQKHITHTQYIIQLYGHYFLFNSHYLLTVISFTHIFISPHTYVPLLSTGWALIMRGLEVYFPRGLMIMTLVLVYYNGINCLNNFSHARIKFRSG